MEVEADEEVQQWAAAARVSHLLPKLSQGGFKEMVAVCLIDANDIALMDITKPGDIKLLLRAVQQAIKASGEPAPAPVWPAANLAPSRSQRPASAHGALLEYHSPEDLRVLQDRFEELAIRQNEKLAILQDEFSDVKTVISNIATEDRTDRSAPTSFAQRYDRLRKVIAKTPWFPVANEHLMLGRGRQAKRLFPVHGYPAVGADETRVVQPYWSDKLKNFPDKHLAVVLKDTHRSVSFGTRKPDVVGYLANKPRSIFHIALVGDVKARRQENNAVFDASEKGQMESFLTDLLLEFQPYRQAVNGFLTDGCLIQFFRLEKLEASTSASELQWTEGPVHFLHDEGDKWLLGLLRNRNAHGLPEDIVINEEPVVMDQLLGVGGLSVVYSGTHQGTQVVVKRFSSAGKLDHLQHEANILGKIKSMVPHVPRLIACDERSLVLLLQPVGLQFASRVSHYTQPANKRRAMATADDFCQLVGILKTVHRDYQLVHRDVRLSNFFRDPKSGKVFLNDWGCATKVAESVPFSGALQHAPFHVLKSYEQKTTYTPQFSDDLEMVVRSVFHSLSMVTFEQIRLEQRVPKIISFWEHHLAPPTWSDMLAAARRADYAGLEMYIRNLLPGTPPKREGEDEGEGDGEDEGSE